MNNIINNMPYLRNSRKFPEELHQLTVEVNKSYVDIANAVNNRTISIFPTNNSAITGESWFLTSQRQQTFRQVYEISSYASINHGINYNSVFTFTVIRAVGYDGTNYFPIPFTNGPNSVSVYVTPTQIVFTPFGVPPALSFGLVILEWMSEP